MDTEKRRMLKFRKNQEVQGYLKGQMEHVQRQKEHNLHKKSMDALDVKQKTKQFVKDMTLKTNTKRSMLTEQQSYNLGEFGNKIGEKRDLMAFERNVSGRIALDQIQQAAYLDQLEKGEAYQKRQRHARDLEKLIDDRAQFSHASQQPVTMETLRKLQLLPEQAEKLSMQDHTSPMSYSNPNTGLLSNIVESRYAF